MAATLIVALDFRDKTDALTLVEQLDPTLCALKVGSEMFTLFGPSWVRCLIEKGFRVFLDLKFLDIPNTVAQSCRACADLGVWMLNVHALGGETMMRAAKEALEPYGPESPLLIAVTVLTSMALDALNTVGIDASMDEQVERLAKLTQLSGLDGVVCSPLDVPRIKDACGASFLTVTPGIRFIDNDRDDQSRIVTPVQAINLGSDHLVVGRPITRSPAPLQVVHQILSFFN